MNVIQCLSLGVLLASLFIGNFHYYWHKPLPKEKLQILNIVSLVLIGLHLVVIYSVFFSQKYFIVCGCSIILYFVSDYLMEKLSYPEEVIEIN